MFVFNFATFHATHAGFKCKKKMKYLPITCTDKLWMTKSFPEVVKHHHKIIKAMIRFREGYCHTLSYTGCRKLHIPASSVADPDVVVPPGSGSGSVSQRSGSVSQRYGSGSGSFYQQAKIIRKTLFPSVLWLLYDFLSLKKVYLPSRRIGWKTLEKDSFFFWRLEGQNGQNSRTRSRIWIH